MSSELLAFLAAVGIGSIVSAIVGRMSAKAVAISNHRQVWINALRDDIVLFLTEIDKMRHAWAMAQGNKSLANTLKSLNDIHQARSAARAVFRRVVLRLNPNEKVSGHLISEMEKLLTVGSPPSGDDPLDRVITLSRRILKHEWAVAKYGALTKPMLALKRLAFWK